MSKGSPKPDRSMCELLQILCLFGVCWAMMRTVLEDLASWIGLFGKKSKFGDLEGHFIVSNVVFLEREREECANFWRIGTIRSSTEVSFSAVPIYMGTCCQFHWLIRFLAFLDKLNYLFILRLYFYTSCVHGSCPLFVLCNWNFISYSSEEIHFKLVR